MGGFADKLYNRILEELESDEFNKLLGKRVKLIQGDHKGKEGKIIDITGYTPGYGVVVKIKLDNGKIVEYSADFWEELEESKSNKEGEMFEKILEQVKANLEEGRIPDPNAKEEEKIKALIEQTTKIKPKHPGILEIPEDKYFYQMPLKHYIGLAKRKGKGAVMRALLNLERWNKEEDPEASKKARDIIDRLKASKEWQELGERIIIRRSDKEEEVKEEKKEEVKEEKKEEVKEEKKEEVKEDEIKELAERVWIAKLLIEKGNLNEKEKAFVDETMKIELDEDKRAKVLEMYKKLFSKA